MGWRYLAAAIAAEVVATSFLASTEGFTRPVATAGVLAGYALSLLLLVRALRTVPLSVAYALWSGIGTAVIAVVGVLFMGEVVTFTKVAGLLLVVSGVVVLELSGDSRGDFRREPH